MIVHSWTQFVLFCHCRGVLACFLCAAAADAHKKEQIHTKNKVFVCGMICEMRSEKVQLSCLEQRVSLSWIQI